MIAPIAVAAAALAAGFTGFGFNLVAVPLLVLVFAPKDAVPIALLLGVLTSSLVAILAGKRNEIDLRLLVLLMAGSLPGLAAGTFIFSAIDPNVLRVLIGVVAASSALLIVLSGRGPLRRVRAGESLGVGLLSGSLAATTGTGGPPVVAYVAMTTREAATVRGTILGHVALVSLLAVFGLALHGELSSAQMVEALKLVPPLVVGLALGSYLFRRSSVDVYRLVINLALIGAAAAGILVAVR